MTHSATQNFVNPHSARQTLIARWFPGVRLAPCTALRVAGMLPVIIVLIIHALAYITVVPGTLYPLISTFPLTAPLLLLVFHIIFIFTLCNYLLLVLIDPGSVPDDWKAPPPTTFFPHTSLPRPRPPHPPTHAWPPSSTTQKVTHNPSSPSEPKPLVQKPPVTSNDIHLQINYPDTTTNTLNNKKTPNFPHGSLMHERTHEGYLRYCRTCKAYKPDRAHHCSVCRRCILRMDHHCVFVNNCVSFYNHKFFVSFVTYAFLGCLIVSIISFPTFADVVSIQNPSSVYQPGHNNGAKVIHIVRFALTPVRHAIRIIIPESIRFTLDRLSAASRLPPTLKTIVMVGYITSSAFAFALGIFVALHLYLVAKGRTTIEMYELTDPVRAPLVAQYDLGIRRNISKVCGTVPFCWFFPTRAFIEGDGLHYDRKEPPHQAHNAV